MNNIYTKFFICLVVSLTAFGLKAEGNYIKLNYGISSNTVDVTAASGTDSGTISTDEEDEGFILSGGVMIGEAWGVDLMYYDMGDSTITVTRDDILQINKANFSVSGAGDISRNVTGMGMGLIVAGDNGSEFLSLSYYFKAGMHAWSKGGSTTLLDDNDGFKSKYYNEGIGAYGGLGVAINLLENTSLDIAYDIIGVSSNGDFDNDSSLLSAGLRVKF